MTVKEYPTPVEVDVLQKKPTDHEPNTRSSEEREQMFREESRANGKVIDLEGNVRDLDEDPRAY